MPQNIIGVRFSIAEPGTLPRSIYCSFSSFCKCGQLIPIDKLCVGVMAPEGEDRIHDFKMISTVLKEVCTTECSKCHKPFGPTEDTIARIRKLALQYFSIKEQVQSRT